MSEHVYTTHRSEPIGKVTEDGKYQPLRPKFAGALAGIASRKIVHKVGDLEFTEEPYESANLEHPREQEQESVSYDTNSDYAHATLTLTIELPVYRGRNTYDLGDLITAIEKAVDDTWPGATVMKD